MKINNVKSNHNNFFSPKLVRRWVTNSLIVASSLITVISGTGKDSFEAKNKLNKNAKSVPIKTLVQNPSIIYKENPNAIFISDSVGWEKNIKIFSSCGQNVKKVITASESYGMSLLKNSKKIILIQLNKPMIL